VFGIAARGEKTCV